MSRARFWCFTLNNPTDSDDLPTVFAEHGNIRYAIWQRETGDSGTEHFQGYLEFKSAQRLAACKKLSARAHWEVRRGSAEQAIDYCRKEEGRVDGPYEFGEAPSKGPGERNDLKALKASIDSAKGDLDLWDEHFGPMLRYHKGVSHYQRLRQPDRSWKTEVIILIGPPGCGKSRWVYDRYPGCYFKQPSTQWWDDYNGQECVILDDFYGWLPFSTMLRLMDRYPLMVEVKGGQTKFVARTLCITSNKRWTQWWGVDVQQRHDMAAFARRVDRTIEWQHDGTMVLSRTGQPDVVVPPPEPDTTPATGVDGGFNLDE